MEENLDALPLKDLLVVSMEGAIAGPLASCKLADAGARVIKIERETGDMARGYDAAVNGESSYFLWLNRGKESAVLDYKKPEDAAVLRKLISRADVFIQNLGPGVAARVGFGAAELRASNDRLITCDISGYGATGPYAELKAYDLLIQAESGVASVTGSPSEASRIGVSACDISAGMNAHAAILEALYHRERTGQGAEIQVSLFDGMAEWMAVPLMHFEYDQTVWPRVGLGNPTLCPYASYPTKDGSKIVIGVSNDGEWRRLAGVLGKPELATAQGFSTNVERVANRATVDEEVCGYTQERTPATVADELKAAGIAYGRVNDIPTLSGHPHLRRIAYETPVGPVTIAAPAAVMPPGRRTYRPVPRLGQHTSLVREEFSVDNLSSSRGV